MPFKTDFGRGIENKQKKSKLGHPTAWQQKIIFFLGTKF